MEQKLLEHRQNISLAAQYIREHWPVLPDTAVILGSGLGPLATALNGALTLEYHDIPGFKQSTALGHVGKLYLGSLGSRPILAMQGRFHCYEGYDILDTVLPVRVFATLGVKNLFVTNAAGGINPAFSDGALMLILDHIALFADSPLRGANIDELGIRFPDMTHTYNPRFAAIARQAAKKTGVKLCEGIYAYAKGPQYETPAEIRALCALGADAVGMSTVGEVIAARHAGMEIIGLSCITNMAAGITGNTLSHEEVFATSQRVSADFYRLVTEIVQNLP